MDESSRLSTLTDDNTKASADGSGKASSDEEQDDDKVPKVKDKKEATEIFKELLREKVIITSF